jgi:transmembrane sensor
MNLLQKIKSLMNQNTSKEDLSQLEAWKSDATHTLEQLKSLSLLDQQFDQMKDYKIYDKQAAFEKITGQSYTEDNIRKLNWKSIAAAAAVILLVSVLFLKNSISTFEKQTYAGDVLKQIELVDKSIVTIDKGSQLSTLSDRIVALNGRGFFSVKTTDDKAKFVVQLNKGTVTVLGTKFSIVSDEFKNEIAVQEGKVKYEYNNQVAILTAGQFISLVNDKIVVSEASKNSFSWKNQVLDFKDTPLTEAIGDLSKYFNVDIAVEKNVVIKSNCLLTTQVKNESVNQMMEELKTIFNITYRKNGNGFVITSIKC